MNRDKKAVARRLGLITINFLREILRYSPKVLLILLFSSVVSVSAYASCPRSVSSIKTTFDKSNMVVKARVLSVEAVYDTKPNRKPNSQKYPISTLATFVVEKRFKGTLKEGEHFDILGTRGCSLMVPEKNVGESYVFYISNKRRIKENESSLPTFSVYSPGPSGLWKLAHRDRPFLEGLEKNKGRTRVSGYFDCLFECDLKFAEIPVRISGGDGSTTVRTNEDGVFESYGLENGKYRVELELPRGYAARFYTLGTGNEQLAENLVSLKITVKSGEHYEVSIYPRLSNSISGRVTGPGGLPIKKVLVFAFPAETPEKAEKHGNGGYTDASGNYTILRLKPGRYRLVINEQGLVTTAMPYPRHYYPGATSYDKGGILNLEAGQKIKGADIVLSEVAGLVKVSGQALDAGGNSLSFVNVWFLPNDPNQGRFANFRVRTDKQGRFEIEVLAGLTGKLFVYATTENVNGVKCIVVDGSYKSGRESVSVQKEDFLVTPNPDPIEFRFSLPACGAN